MRETSTAPCPGTLPQSTIDLVREIYHYDFELYEWAKKRFEKQLAQIDLGGDFEAYRASCIDQYKDRLLTTGGDNLLADQPRGR